MKKLTQSMKSVLKRMVAGELIHTGLAADESRKGNAYEATMVALLERGLVTTNDSLLSSYEQEWCLTAMGIEAAK